ncbi:MAG: hypothetical protein V2A70_07640 [Candidatus Omnitrophota bacterium]
MKIRHIILLLLLHFGGRIDSKTKLQKLLYFLSLKFSRDFGFSPYFYGPYSSVIESEVDDLVGAGFVEVERCLLGVDAKRGFEVKKYSFQLTEEGKSFANDLKGQHIDEANVIKGLVDQVKAKGDLDYLSLSIAAKSHYILKHANRPMTGKDIESKAKDFSWEIDSSDINKAISILKEWGLVTAG